jgi:YvrJ protein family
VERRFCLSTSRYNHLSELKNQVTKEMSRKGEDQMDEMLKLVANFGFPIVLSAYLLVRIEGKLAELTNSITELAKVIAVIKA